MRLGLVIWIIFILINGTALTYADDLWNPQGMVVTAHSLATNVAVEILNKGGNAVDAAVAAMFALPIVEPWASGLGGGGFMLLKMSNNPEPFIIDYRECAPIEAKPQLFYRDRESFKYYAYTGYRSICVPGMVAGARVALKKYGTMDVKQVLEPAIKLANDGFPVSFEFYRLICKYYDIIELNRTSSDIYFPDYLPLAEGDTLRRNDLAHLYELLGQNGLNEFYKGKIANDLIAQIQQNNGLLTVADLNSYYTVNRNPVRGTYRGYDIVTIPPPGFSGVALIQLLNILEGYNLKRLGHLTGDYIHVFIEALKYVLNDREKYAGDPDFNPLRFDNFITKQYSAAIRLKIDTLEAQNMPIKNVASIFESENASHVSVVDGEGNCVSFTQTINFYFGSGVTLPEYGVLCNNGLFHFSQDSLNTNAVAPKKRSASSMSPLIVMRNGSPYLILGTSGAGRTISTLAHILVSIIDFQMNINDALDAPRFHIEDGIVQLETRILSDHIEHLKKLDHKVNLKTDYHTYFGIAQGIMIDPENGLVSGAADPRGEGTAVKLVVQ